MKFNLPEDQVRIDFNGDQVQLSFRLFSGLVNYVEDLEAKLLAREINLREVEHLTGQMEELSVEKESSTGDLPDKAVAQLDEMTAMFSNPNRPLLDAMREKKMSIRQLSMTTSIPYATVYRYVVGKGRPKMETASRILRAISLRR